MDTKAIRCPHREASSVLVERYSEELAPSRGMVMGGLVESLVVEIRIAVVVVVVVVVVVAGSGGGFVGDAAIVGLVKLVIVHVEDINLCF